MKKQPKEAGATLNDVRVSVAKKAAKLFGDDLSHMVVICLHKKLPSKPIIIFRGELLTAAKLVSFAMKRMQASVSDAING